MTSKLAQTLHEAVYPGESADPNSPENQNKDFLDGFDVGRADNEQHGTHAIVNEYLRRGGTDDGSEELVTQDGFREWKRGYWAGRFTRLDEDTKKSAKQ